LHSTSFRPMHGLTCFSERGLQGLKNATKKPFNPCFLSVLLFGLHSFLPKIHLHPPAYDFKMSLRQMPGPCPEVSARLWAGRPTKLHTTTCLLPPALSEPPSSGTTHPSLTRRPKLVSPARRHVVLPASQLFLRARMRPLQAYDPLSFAFRTRRQMTSALLERSPSFPHLV